MARTSRDGRRAAWREYALTAPAEHLQPRAGRTEKRRALCAPAMARAGWTRTDPRPWRKTVARWEHVDGWRLVHCGHPTALHPWELFDPLGRLVLTGAAGPERNPEHGKAWRCLADVVAYVARAFVAVAR